MIPDELTLAEAHQVIADLKSECDVHRATAIKWRDDFYKMRERLVNMQLLRDEAHFLLSSMRDKASSDP